MNIKCLIFFVLLFLGLLVIGKRAKETFDICKPKCAPNMPTTKSTLEMCECDMLREYR